MPRGRATPKGKTIFWNPIPVPVSAHAKGKRFSLENVEWISLHESTPVSHGGIGKLFWGKVKFKRQKPKLAVVKQFRFPKEVNVPQYEEVIKRLNESKAAFPKTGLFRSGEKIFLVQEAFGDRSLGWRRSKFSHPGSSVVSSLHLKKPIDQQVFQQMCEQTALLAKAGLAFKLVWGQDTFVNPRIVDVFNFIWLKSKRYKVFVQDLDALFPQNDSRLAWQQSSNALLTAVSEFGTAMGNSVIATKLLQETAFRHHLT